MKLKQKRMEVRQAPVAVETPRATLKEMLHKPKQELTVDQNPVQGLSQRAQPIQNRALRVHGVEIIASSEPFVKQQSITTTAMSASANRDVSCGTGSKELYAPHAPVTSSPSRRVQLVGADTGL